MSESGATKSPRKMTLAIRALEIAQERGDGAFMDVVREHAEQTSRTSYRFKDGSSVKHRDGYYRTSWTDGKGKRHRMSVRARLTRGQFRRGEGRPTRRVKALNRINTRAIAAMAAEEATNSIRLDGTPNEVNPAAATDVEHHQTARDLYDEIITLMNQYELPDDTRTLLERDMREIARQAAERLGDDGRRRLVESG